MGWASGVRLGRGRTSQAVSGQSGTSGNLLAPSAADRLTHFSSRRFKGVTHTRSPSRHRGMQCSRELELQRKPNHDTLTVGLGLNPAERCYEVDPGNVRARVLSHAAVCRLDAYGLLTR